MPRPLEISPCFGHATTPQNMSFSGWLTFVLRKAIEYPLHVAIANAATHPLLVFPDLAALNLRMNLKQSWLDHSGKSPRIISCPPVAPAQHDPDHFAQWALAWEPVDTSTHTRAQRTLALEVGGGLYMISMVFTPVEDRHNGPMQLDRLRLHYGHQSYPITVTAGPCPATNLHNQWMASTLLVTAAEVISFIQDDSDRVQEHYDRAELELAEGCRPVLETLKEQPAVPKPPATPRIDR